MKILPVILFLLSCAFVSSQPYDTILEINNYDPSSAIIEGSNMFNPFYVADGYQSEIGSYSIDFYFQVVSFEPVDVFQSVFLYQQPGFNDSISINFATSMFRFQLASYTYTVQTIPIQNNTMIFLHFQNEYEFNLYINFNTTWSISDSWTRPSDLTSDQSLLLTGGNLKLNYNMTQNIIRYHNLMIFSNNVYFAYDTVYQYIVYGEEYEVVNVNGILTILSNYDFRRSEDNEVCNLAYIVNVNPNCLSLSNDQYLWRNYSLELSGQYYQFSSGTVQTLFDLEPTYRYFFSNLSFGFGEFEYTAETTIMTNNFLVSKITTSQIPAGDYAIYLSLDNLTYYESDAKIDFLNNNDLILPSAANYNYLYGIDPNTYYSNFDTNYVIYAGIAASGFLFLLFFFLVRCCRSERILNSLSLLDYLRLQRRDKNPIQNEIPQINTNFDADTIRKNNIILEEERYGVGISYKVHKQTTALGGIFTIVCVLMSLCLIATYLYETLNDNVVITSNISISNGLQIVNQGQELNFSLTFPYLPSQSACISGNSDATKLEGPCGGELTAEGAGIVLNQNPNVTCSQAQMEYTGFKSCTITFISNDFSSLADTFTINFNTIYLYNLYINTTVSMSSYIPGTPSTITNTISAGSDQIFAGPIIYYSLTPVSYTYYDNPLQLGYVLDYKSVTYSNGDQSLYSNIPESSTITFSFSKNSNWIFLNVNSQSSGLVILAQVLAIATGVISIGGYIYNTICNEHIRRGTYKVFNLDRVDVE